MKTRILSIVALMLSLFLSVASFAACGKKEDTNNGSDGLILSEDDIALDPDAVDSEGHQLPQPTISTARINGSYLVTGTEGWEDFTDPTQNSTDEIELLMSVFPSSNSELSITIVNTALERTFAYTVTDYDPLTGTCTLPPDDEDKPPMQVVFSEKDGKIVLSMSYEQVLDGRRFFGSYDGVKK